MMGLQIKMWLLVVLMFGILYGIITGFGTYFGTGSATSYIILAFLFLGFQYLIGPKMVEMLMRVKYLSEEEEPELHQMVKELSQKAGIPKPKIGISQISIPNAFAFGRSIRDGRVCVTRGIQQILTKEELKGVLGHEISHLKNRDMLIITLLSVIPLICYWLAFHLMWGGMLGNKREGGNYAFLIGLGAMLAYFITNLLVLAGSRIREYYADEGSVRIGNPPHHLATALYKLSFSSARLQRDPKAQEELRRISGAKAFFLNDISQAENEIRELEAVDKDLSGTIDQNELLALRSQRVKLSTAEKMMEIFTTHPNMLKRIKRLSTLA
ncbi:MAG: M48 family metalloprotease [Patescibacteria group bacterium]|nr:M48 family metalloprotease [Patescibacteria group bacterium]